MPGKKSGFCYRYEVQKTASKGLGVFAREDIKLGSVVWRHVPGLFNVHDEQSFNAMISGMSPAQVIYELEHCYGMADFPSCVIQVLDGGALLNHSSSANLATVNEDPATPPLQENADNYLREVTQALIERYVLVATREIYKGEELTTNYNLECHEPLYFETLYEQYEISDDYLDAP